jgi:hypothetical protein
VVSPYINRFLQPDTIIPNPANPQSLNRFGYVLNNPIRFNDPTGHVCSDPEAAAANNLVCYGTGTTRVGNRMIRGNGAELGRAKNLLPAWWRNEAHIYIDGFGYFDAGHIRRGFESAQNLLLAAEAAIDEGGGVFPVQSGGSDYAPQYFVSASVDDDELLGVLYAIYMDYEFGYETYQATHLNGSAFSPEDLPSDHLGFWVYMHGYNLSEIPALLSSLGEVRDLGTSQGGSLVVDVITNSQNTGVSFPRNYEFLPMVTETIPYIGGTIELSHNVAWPSWLVIEPIPSGPNTWLRTSP